MASETLNVCVATKKSQHVRLLSLPGASTSQQAFLCWPCHKQCRVAGGCPPLQHSAHLKPMSISRSPSSKISVCSLLIAWRLSAPCFRRSSRRPGVATRMWGGLLRRRLASVFTLVPPTTVCKGRLLLGCLHPACAGGGGGGGGVAPMPWLAVPGRMCHLFSIQDAQGCTMHCTQDITCTDSLWKCPTCSASVAICIASSLVGDRMSTARDP